MKLTYALVAWCIILSVYCGAVTAYLLANRPHDELATELAKVQTEQTIAQAKIALQESANAVLKSLAAEGEKQTSSVSDMGKSQGKALSNLMRDYMEEVNAHRQALDWAVRIAKSNSIN